jgi:hypothetical protein
LRVIMMNVDSQNSGQYFWAPNCIGLNLTSERSPINDKSRTERNKAQPYRCLSGPWHVGSRGSPAQYRSVVRCESRRIAEVKGRELFPEAEPASPEKLPPPGPYLSGRAAAAAVQALEEAKNALDLARARMEMTLIEIRGGRL